MFCGCNDTSKEPEKQSRAVWKGDESKSPDKIGSEVGNTVLNPEDVVKRKTEKRKLQQELEDVDAERKALAKEMKKLASDRNKVLNKRKVYIRSKNENVKLEEKILHQKKVWLNKQMRKKDVDGPAILKEVADMVETLVEIQEEAQKEWDKINKIRATLQERRAKVDEARSQLTTEQEMLNEDKMEFEINTGECNKRIKETYDEQQRLKDLDVDIQKRQENVKNQSSQYDQLDEIIERRVEEVSHRESVIAEIDIELKRENGLVKDITQNLYSSLERKRAAFNENFSQLTAGYFKWASGYSDLFVSTEQEIGYIKAVTEAETIMRDNDAALKKMAPVIKSDMVLEAPKPEIKQESAEDLKKNDVDSEAMEINKVDNQISVDSKEPMAEKVSQVLEQGDDGGLQVTNEIDVEEVANMDTVVEDNLDVKIEEEAAVEKQDLQQDVPKEVDVASEESKKKEDEESMNREAAVEVIDNNEKADAEEQRLKEAENNLEIKDSEIVDDTEVVVAKKKDVIGVVEAQEQKIADSSPDDKIPAQTEDTEIVAPADETKSEKIDKVAENKTAEDTTTSPSQQPEVVEGIEEKESDIAVETVSKDLPAAPAVKENIGDETMNKDDEPVLDSEAGGISQEAKHAEQEKENIKGVVLDKADEKVVDSKADAIPKEAKHVEQQKENIQGVTLDKDDEKVVDSKADTIPNEAKHAEQEEDVAKEQETENKEGDTLNKDDEQVVDSIADVIPQEEKHTEQEEDVAANSGDIKDERKTEVEISKKTEEVEQEVNALPKPEVVEKKASIPDENKVPDEAEKSSDIKVSEIADIDKDKTDAKVSETANIEEDKSESEKSALESDDRKYVEEPLVEHEEKSSNISEQPVPDDAAMELTYAIKDISELGKPLVEETDAKAVEEPLMKHELLASDDSKQPAESKPEEPTAEVDKNLNESNLVNGVKSDSEVAEDIEKPTEPRPDELQKHDDQKVSGLVDELDRRPDFDGLEETKLEVAEEPKNNGDKEIEHTEEVKPNSQDSKDSAIEETTFGGKPNEVTKLETVLDSQDKKVEKEVVLEGDRDEKETESEIKVEEILETKEQPKLDEPKESEVEKQQSENKGIEVQDNGGESKADEDTDRSEKAQITNISENQELGGTKKSEELKESEPLTSQEADSQVPRLPDNDFEKELVESKDSNVPNSEVLKSTEESPVVVESITEVKEVEEVSKPEVSIVSEKLTDDCKVTSDSDVSTLKPEVKKEEEECAPTVGDKQDSDLPETEGLSSKENEHETKHVDELAKQEESGKLDESKVVSEPDANEFGAKVLKDTEESVDKMEDMVEAKEVEDPVEAKEVEDPVEVKAVDDDVNPKVTTILSEQASDESKVVSEQVEFTTAEKWAEDKKETQPSENEIVTKPIEELEAGEPVAGEKMGLVIMPVTEMDTEMKSESTDHAESDVPKEAVSAESEDIKLEKVGDTQESSSPKVVAVEEKSTDDFKSVAENPKVAAVEEKSTDDFKSVAENPDTLKASIPKEESKEENITEVVEAVEDSKPSLSSGSDDTKDTPESEKKPVESLESERKVTEDETTEVDATPCEDSEQKAISDTAVVETAVLNKVPEEQEIPKVEMESKLEDTKENSSEKDIPKAEMESKLEDTTGNSSTTENKPKPLMDSKENDMEMVMQQSEELPEKKSNEIAEENIDSGKPDVCEQSDGLKPKVELDNGSDIPKIVVPVDDHKAEEREVLSAEEYVARESDAEKQEERTVTDNRVIDPLEGKEAI